MDGSESAHRDESVLIGGVEKREIRIEDYDPAWQLRYDEHERIIVAALGHSLLQIEHFGSTSVPGLAAKAIIDILVVVLDSADEPSYLPQLEAAGYELRVREPNFHQHRMLRTPSRDVHVHVYSEGATEIQRILTFRDRLRDNADERARYENLKRHLAQQSWSDMNAYADAKSDIVESIIAAASDRSARNERPGPESSSSGR